MILRPMEVRIERQADGTYIAYNQGVPGLVAIGTGNSVEEAETDFNNSLEEIAETMTEEEKHAILTPPEFRLR